MVRVHLSPLWGYSSVGRAPALQAGGHEFESRYLHENIGRAVGVWKAAHEELVLRSGDGQTGGHS